MSIRRRNNSIQKGIKDYIVPIVGLLLIIVLIYSLFSGGGDDKTVIQENKVGLELVLDGVTTESYIEYPGNYKKKIEENTTLYKGEKVIVKDGSVALSLESLGNLNLNKLGELTYLENGGFLLSSSDLWIDSKSKINLDMRFAKVKIGENTHISFSQNEMGSTIYLINGTAEITNLVGQSTILANGQKITVSRLDASNQEIDMTLLKENIDDFYKQSDWFIKNNGETYMKLSEQKDEDKDEENLEEESSSGTTIKETGEKLINITNLTDDTYVSSDSIDISGNFTSDEVKKITVNGVEAIINSEGKTFKFLGVSIPEKENDLVFKVYDDANDIISRFVYTIYYNGGSETQTTGSTFNVQTFDVDGSQFVFTSVKDGTTQELYGKTSYSTYGDFLTIYGKVSAKGISKVSVNGYMLQSFDGTYWRYHCSSLNENLSVGTNVYDVKYYDANGKEVYSNQFMIIKKSDGSSSNTTGNNQTTTPNTTTTQDETTFSGD